MKKSHSVLLWIIAACLLRGLVKDLRTLSDLASSDEYFVFARGGHLDLLYTLMCAALLLGAASVYFIYRPRPEGLWICAAALFNAVIYDLCYGYYALADLPGLRRVYLAGRAARGLSTDAAQADQVFSAQGMQVLMGAGCLIGVAGLAVLWVTRRHFLSAASLGQRDAAP